MKKTNIEESNEESACLISFPLSHTDLFNEVSDLLGIRINYIHYQITSRPQQGKINSVCLKLYPKELPKHCKQNLVQYILTVLTKPEHEKSLSLSERKALVKALEYYLTPTPSELTKKIEERLEHYTQHRERRTLFSIIGKIFLAISIMIGLACFLLSPIAILAFIAAGALIVITTAACFFSLRENSVCNNTVGEKFQQFIYRLDGNTADTEAQSPETNKQANEENDFYNKNSAPISPSNTTINHSSRFFARPPSIDGQEINTPQTSDKTMSLPLRTVF